MTERIELFDSHLHIIDSRFPIVPNHGFLPDEFTCEDYIGRTGSFNILGGAIVSGSFQAFDQSYLLSALRLLGPSFVGVTQLPYNTSDAQVIELNSAGVRALRFNLYRGGSENIEHMVSMAKRVYDLVGWHIELYVDSVALEELSPIIKQLPSVSIDHFGMSSEGFPYLLPLAEKGVKIKATGFGRINLKVPEAIKSLYQANPDALMFGTDLPSTRAAVPFKDSDAGIVLDAIGSKAATKVFKGNAIQFYKPIAS